MWKYPHVYYVYSCWTETNIFHKTMNIKGEWGGNNNYAFFSMSHEIQFPQEVTETFQQVI